MIGLRRRWVWVGAAIALIVLLGLVVGLAGGSHHVARSSAVTSKPARRRVATTRARQSSSTVERRELGLNKRILGYTPYLALGSPRRREVALTFDDGPSTWTPKILAVLRREHAVATFFEIGREARAHPRYTAELVRAGMPIGDHTETHPPLGELPAAAQRREIAQAARSISSAGAPSPLLFRPPYGSFNSKTLAILRARHMLMVLWSVDTSDYLQPGAARIANTAISGARPGAVILFHDGGGRRSQTLAALPRVIHALRRRGFRLVTIWKLLHDDPPPRHQAPPRDLSGL